MPPTRSEYIERQRGKSNFTARGRVFRRAVRQAVREQGRLTFKPVSVSIVMHQAKGPRISLPETHAVLMSALTSSTAFLTERQLDHVEYMRGEDRPEGCVVVILEGAQ